MQRAQRDIATTRVAVAGNERHHGRAAALCMLAGLAAFTVMLLMAAPEA